MENNKDILKKTTAMNLYLRIFIGGFLMYLAYTLGVELGSMTGNDKIIIGAAVILFAVAGVIIVGWSIFRLVKKDYYDPMTDMTEDSSDAEETKKE